MLNSTKSSDIAATVKGLTPEECDGLMKFIYKGMEKTDELEINPSVLLGWHEKVRLSSSPSVRFGRRLIRGLSCTDGR